MSAALLLLCVLQLLLLLLLPTPCAPLPCLAFVLSVAEL
jgi:hypothetical protein